MGSIISALDIRIAEHPDKLLYSFLDKKGGVKESYTYREFDEKTNRVASYLSENYEFKPGDRIILAYPPGLESICSFFACVKLGLIPVPVILLVLKGESHKAQVCKCKN
jgi:acyl-CoA synthetase (AMP-forming)/AMP-acid ligase II